MNPGPWYIKKRSVQYQKVPQDDKAPLVVFFTMAFLPPEQLEEKPAK